MKSLFWKLAHEALLRSEKERFCWIYNLLHIRNKRQRRCRYENGLYNIQEKDFSIFISRRQRYRYYANGVKPRLNELFDTYTGGHVEILPGDVVIDCGANIGEFTQHCLLAGANCLSFEPDPVEFAALKRNCGSKATIYPNALWNENTTLPIQFRNETGDTSIDPDAKLEQATAVECHRLDSLSTVAAHKRIKLLKLEAEGYEPEVLMGTGAVLDRIEFIAADLGPERGEKQETTLPYIVNYLLGRGFRVKYYHPGRSIVLFENLSFASEGATIGDS